MFVLLKYNVREHTRLMESNIEKRKKKKQHSVIKIKEKKLKISNVSFFLNGLSQGIWKFPGARD